MLPEGSPSRVARDFESLLLLVAQLPTMLWVTDETLTITSIGGGPLAGLQSDAPRLSGPYRLTDLFQQHEAVLEAHTRALAGEAGSYEVSWKGRVFKCHVRPLRDEGGRLTGTVGLGLDVTEDRAAEAALRASERMHQAMLDTTLDCVITMDGRGRIVEFNRSAERAFGYRRAEVIGHELAALIIPERFRTRHREGLARFLATGEAPAIGQRLELPAMRADGEEFLSEIVITYIPDESAPHFVAYLRDISERKHAEEAIRERDARFQLVARATNDAVWDWNLVTNTVWWNEGPQSLFGYAPRDVGGDATWWSERIHKDDLDRIIQSIHAAIDGDGHAWSDEYRFRRADGSYADILDRGYILREAGGTAVRMLGAMADISARKQAEAAIRASEARYRALVQHATYGIYRSTMDGRILDVNPALAAMLGYSSPGELMATQNFKNLYLNPDDRTRLLEQLAGTGLIAGAEVVWKRLDGTPVTVRLSGRVVEDAGKEQGFEIIVEDVTERHALEEQLRQAQKIEAVGQLAGGVAHDFNNLLMIIYGCSELAQEKIGAEHPATADVGEIRKAAESAATLTRQLLAFSRKQVLRPRVLTLNDTVTRMQSLLERLLGEHIQLATDLAPSLDEVYADASQLEQVILNLAVNARDAMPTGGRLTIATANVSFGSTDLARQCGAPGAFVRVTISDTGVGMDDSVRARLFEPFFTTKDVGQGTGMGLATVYGIVRQSGGFIWVDSAPGRGTTFKIDFPRAQQEKSRAAAERGSPAPAPSGETVLLVEDMPEVRAVTRQLLARSGYRVLEAGCGDEALRVAASFDGIIHLLLTDVVMPGMSGPELARRLCVARPAMRVLLASGYADARGVSGEAGDAGMPFLQKPFTRSALLEKVRTVLVAPPSRF